MNYDLTRLFQQYSNNLSEYDKQVLLFLIKTNTKINIEYEEFNYHFKNDKTKRDIYNITISRNNRSYSFRFGQSVVNSGYKFTLDNGKRLFRVAESDVVRHLTKDHKYHQKFCNIVDKQYNYITAGDDTKVNIINPIEPSNYDILSSLSKYDCGTFDNFCLEYGYNNDSISALEIYKAVKSEYENLQRLYSEEEIEWLREIQ